MTVAKHTMTAMTPTIEPTIIVELLWADLGDDGLSKMYMEHDNVLQKHRHHTLIGLLSNQIWWTKNLNLIVFNMLYQKLSFRYLYLIFL